MWKKTGGLLNTHVRITEKFLLWLIRRVKQKVALTHVGFIFSSQTSSFNEGPTNVPVCSLWCQNKVIPEKSWLWTPECKHLLPEARPAHPDSPFKAARLHRWSISSIEPSFLCDLEAVLHVWDTSLWAEGGFWSKLVSLPSVKGHWCKHTPHLKQLLSLKARPSTRQKSVSFLS